jgi:hypothetical protein
MKNFKKNIDIKELIQQEGLIKLYLDIIYQDIVNDGIYPTKELHINKPGVPYPIAKALLNFLENQERYEKCKVIHEAIKKFKKSQNKKRRGKSNINKA